MNETQAADRDERLLALYERQVLSSQAHVDVTDLEELDRQPQMYLAMHRFRPPTEERKSEGKGLTLLLSHANGFHKGEIYLSSTDGAQLTPWTFQRPGNLPSPNFSPSWAPLIHPLHYR